MVLGSGTSALLGEVKLKADVRSPATARRQVVMLFSRNPGYCAPNRRSINRISEVWSSTSELTQPPLLQGEMTTMGTRTPNPYGPAAYFGLPGKISLVVSIVDIPWARDCGTVGGTTWSKKPSFSS